MLTTPTIYLPGHDQGEPQFATPGSAGYDLPAILTRPLLSNDDRKWLVWKTNRKPAFHQVSPDERRNFDTIIEYLKDREPAEIQKIKASNKGFPVHYLKVRVQPGETLRIPLGIKTAIPEGYMVLLFARASSAKKDYRLGNCVGVIDSDYRDEWYAAIRNEGKDFLVIEHGQRIVQAVFFKRTESGWPASESLPESNRAGGFGSTGETSELTPEETASLDVANVAESEQQLEAGLDPMSQLDGELTPEAAASLAGQIGTLPNPLNPSIQEDAGDIFEEISDDEFLPIKLSCGGVSIGPVAKFRPDVHSVIYKEQGAEGVAAILIREAAESLPAALTQLVEAVFQRTAVSQEAPAEPANAGE